MVDRSLSRAVKRALSAAGLAYSDFEVWPQSFGAVVLWTGAQPLSRAAQAIESAGVASRVAYGVGCLDVIA